jgi:hypothetical protein
VSGRREASIEVWLVPVVPGAAADAGLVDLIGPADRDSISGLGMAADRDRAVTARVAARRALGRRLGLHPRDVPLVTGGRPVVARADIGVSWSHSGGWLALALSVGGPVGVDIERVPQPVPAAALASIGMRTLGDFVAYEAAGKVFGGGLGEPWPADVTARPLTAPAGYLAAVAAPGDDWSVALHGETPG